MKKRSMLYNKMILGALTVADLRELVKIEGVFSFGSNWLPISRVRKKRDMMEIGIGDLDTDIRIPLDSIVKVQGNMVFLDLDTSLIEGGHMMVKDKVELKIKLDEAPFPEIS